MLGLWYIHHTSKSPFLICQSVITNVFHPKQNPFYLNYENRLKFFYYLFIIIYHTYSKLFLESCLNLLICLPFVYSTYIVRILFQRFVYLFTFCLLKIHAQNCFSEICLEFVCLFTICLLKLYAENYLPEICL